MSVVLLDPDATVKVRAAKKLICNYLIRIVKIKKALLMRGQILFIRMGLGIVDFGGHVNQRIFLLVSILLITTMPILASAGAWDDFKSKSKELKEKLVTEENKEKAKKFMEENGDQIKDKAQQLIKKLK